jgi:hypothetical protein
MSMPNISEEERQAILLELTETPKDVLDRAKTAAALLVDDEEDARTAYLLYTYYFSRPENATSLNEALGVFDSGDQ